MYAVIKADGRQLTVKEGDVLQVGQLAAKVGEKVTFSDVLLLGGSGAPKLGTPTISGASVTATVKEHKRGDKVLIFKYKRRKNYKRTRGHRQALTVLQVDTVKGV